MVNESSQGTGNESASKPEYPFELTIILPVPPHYGLQQREAPALQLPANSKELIRDLKGVVTESPEGFWLGAFGFVRDGDETNTRLGDWEEIGTAFEGEEYSDQSKQRAVRVVDVPLDDTEVRTHVLRVRDVLHNVSPSLASRVGFNRLPNDPTAVAVEAGCSQYLALRSGRSSLHDDLAADSSSPVEHTPLALTNGDLHSEGAPEASSDIPASSSRTAHVQELVSPSSPKKRKSGHNKSKSRARQPSAQADGVNNVEHNLAEQVSQALIRLPSAEHAAEPSTKPKGQSGVSHAPNPSDPNSHVFDNWTQDDSFADPFAVITAARVQQSTEPLPLLRTFAVSPYSPPPQHLRLRGHLLYLAATTLEGTSLHIVASTRGYYVDQTAHHGFDSRIAGDKQIHSSLFSLLSYESSLFVRNLQARLEPLPPDQPDIFANAAPSACSMAAPWLVDRPRIDADQLRPQLAFVSTGQIQPDITPPPTRDWNDELISMREMPTKTPAEKLIRDRLLAKWQADFSVAAGKSVQMIVRGDLPPLNPNETRASYTYLHNNILLISAEDSQGQHAILGGDEASRVAVMKDLHGVRILNALDIPGVHSAGTAVVDYQGERFVAQALLPGLLGPGRPEELPSEETKKDADTEPTSAAEEVKSLIDSDVKVAGTPAEEAAAPSPSITDQKNDNFKIIYGSTDTERPELGAIVAEPKCHELASKVAQHLHLAQHAVKSQKTETSTDLWLPLEVKGILGADGRTYLIDLYRLQPVDITWLEKDLDGPLLTLQNPPVASNGKPQMNGVNGVNGVNGANGNNGHVTDSDSESSSTVGPNGSVSTTYPHHFALLRPQLLEKFREDELRRFVQERVSLSRLSGLMQHDSENSMEWQRIAREAHALPDKSTDQKDGDSKDMIESMAAGGHQVFEMSSFEVMFNPDSYVERRDGPKIGEFPETEKATKLVRAASVYLREFLLPDYVSDVAVITPQPHDGYELTKQMHERGIPMRYLGYLTAACEKPPRGLPDRHAPAAKTPMAQLKVLAMNEMTFRAAKHVLRRLLRSRPTIEVAPLVSHFLNCLVGDQANPRPKPDLSDMPSSSRSPRGEWESLTVHGLRDLLCQEIASRFRFAMPRSFFDSADYARPQLLRDVCSRLGIQLLLRQYSFSRDQSSPRSATTFVPDDVINLVPIVHDAPHKANWIDEHFEQGQNHVRIGQLALGEATIAEALSFSEQVFGNVHPDLARKYHELAVLYHSVATPIMRNANVYEHGHALSSSVEDRARSTKESGLETKEQMLEAKREAQNFFEQAVRMARQSVIVAERCYGLDHVETLQNYIDLAILEHANDRPQLALFFCKHALDLLALISRKAHTDWSRIMLNASQIVQAWQGYKAAAPLFRQTRDITALARGTETYVTATIFTTCAAGLANAQQLKEAVQIQKEAVAIFEARFGELDDRTKDARGTLNQLVGLAHKKEQGDREKVQRLMRRLRTDEARAKEIIAGRAGSIKDKEVATATTMEEPTAPKFAHLAIDDIVKMIEGEPTATTKRRKG